jgi:hypothetical protein
MAEKKRTINILGFKLPVTEVPIAKDDEKFVRYELEDGTVLRVKNVATSAMRVDGQFLPDGRPIYFVFSNPVVSVESSPFTKDAEPSTEAGPKKIN